MKLFRAMATVGSMTLLSRVAGFIRDMLTAAILGAGPVADAFFVALKLPNFFRRVTAEGAFSVSFVPMYSAMAEKEGRDAANSFAENTMAVMLAVLVPFTILALFAMPWIIYAIAPGFADEPERYAMAVELSRITFPYLLMMSLVALMGGVLNSIDRFAPFAAAPVAFNLCLIFALLFLTDVLDTAGHAMAVGVAIAGVVQFIWLYWSCRRANIKLRLRRPQFTENTRKLFRLMGPGVIGAGVVQINLFIDVVLASLLPTGSISFLYYADRLNQLPLGVVGIAVGTALLPMLSKALSSGKNGEATNLFNRALEISLLLAAPAALALIAIPGPILTVLFERGEFGSAQTAATASALAAYAIGLPAFVLVKVLNTAFYSRQDTATPVRAAVVATIVNTALSLALIVPLKHVGIALATGVTAWLHLGLMTWWLHKREGLDLDGQFTRRAPRIILCALVMAAALWGGNRYFGAGFDAGLAQQIVLLAAFVGGGAALYGGMAYITGVLRPADLRSAFIRRRDASAS